MPVSFVGKNSRAEVEQSERDYLTGAAASWHHQNRPTRRYQTGRHQIGMVAAIRLE